MFSKDNTYQLALLWAEITIGNVCRNAEEDLYTQYSAPIYIRTKENFRQINAKSISINNHLSRSLGRV
jgi:type II secretory pathway component HofQ